MPIGVFLAGLAMFISGMNDTQEEFMKLLGGDIIGEKSFVPWAASIALVGALGMYRPIRPVSDAFLGLILLQLALSSVDGIKAVGDAFTPGGAKVIPLDQYRSQ